MSNDVLLKFRLWRKGHTLHIHVMFPYDLEFSKGFRTAGEATDDLCKFLKDKSITGTPNYSIEDNTDPEKVFVVYAKTSSSTGEQVETTNQSSGAVQGRVE